MKKITDIFTAGKPTLSFEFFPPKTPMGRIKLYEKVSAFAALKPDFFSVTYGAGGGTREFTQEVAFELQKRFGVPVMQHLAAVGHSADDVRNILDNMKSRGIRNVMALRGDAPEGLPSPESSVEEFPHASNLCAFIRREYDGHFAIGVAGYPEGHPDCSDPSAGAEHLKKKLAAGGEFVVTQLFFDNKKYFEYARLLSERGVNVRVIPGVLPITDYGRLMSFCLKCKVEIPAAVHEKFRPLADDPAATFEAGVKFARSQCEELLSRGAPGLHIYTLNQSEAALASVESLIK
ncbi:MAG: methylenetetrahydrofolate reductase [Endomicrobiia bacterium]|nr:methylenetetrahydrofolate reductase [Endomicrobiia bacterium]